MKRIAGIFPVGVRERLPVWQLTALSLPFIPMAAFGSPLGFFLPAFYTGEMGISLTAYSLIIFIARIWDSAVDPITGILSDRFPSVLGRRRHWMLVGLPVAMVSSVLLFVPQYFVAAPGFLYVLVAMCIMHLGTTLISLNHMAWVAELSDDYYERSRVMGWRSIFGGLSSVFVLGIPLYIEFFGVTATNADKLFGFAILVVITMPLCLGIAVTSVGERPMPREVKSREQQIGVWKSLKLLVSNRVLGRVLAVEILTSFPISIKVSLFVFFAQFVLELPRMTTLALMSIMVVGPLTTPLWMRFAKGREKHKVVAYSALGVAVVTPGYLLVGGGDLWIMLAVGMGISLFNSGPAFISRSIMVDVVDSDTARSGTQRTGTLFAILELTTKIVPTLGVLIVFPLLDVIGFDPSGKNNTPEAINALRYMFALMPSIPVLIGAYLIYTFPLGHKEQEELRRQIDTASASEASA